MFGATLLSYVCHISVSGPVILSLDDTGEIHTNVFMVQHFNLSLKNLCFMARSGSCFPHLQRTRFPPLGLIVHPRALQPRPKVLKHNTGIAFHIHTPVSVFMTAVCIYSRMLWTD